MPKSISASVTGSDRGTNKSDPKLVGETNEVSVKINGQQTTALLDTGSCVSVIGSGFYQEHLKDIEILPLNQILQIECADGQQLPYLGYIEAELEIDKGIPNSTSQHCLFLIVPDTNYSTRTPAIIGTNILNEFLIECKDNFGEQFLNRAKLHTPWYLSFRSMVLRERELKRNNNRLAVVKSAISHKMQVKPNETVTIKAYTDKELPYKTT